MADSPNLPGSHAWPPKSPGEWRDFYGFLRDLVRFVRQTSGNSDSLTALEARITALENAPEPDLGQISGDMSVFVQGLLGQVVQLRLVNDTELPSDTHYYGTDADGTKGWHAVSDTLAEGSGIDLTVDADGVTEIAHGDTSSVANFSSDSSGGTVIQDLGVTFDGFGHVQTVTAATVDLDLRYQPLDTDLTAIAALSPANDDVIQRKAGAWTNRTMAQLLVDLGIAGSYQPLDATLTALAGLDATAGLVEQTGPDTFAKRAMGVAASTSVLTRADGDGRYDSTGSAAAALTAANIYTDDSIFSFSQAENTWPLTQTFTLPPVFSDQAGTRTAIGAVGLTGNEDVAGVKNFLNSITFGVTSFALRANTADGSDTASVYFAGGGTNSGTRGSSITAFGNESATGAGKLLLRAGNVAGAFLDFDGGTVFRSAITPTALAANTDNWAPTGILLSSRVRVSASAGINLTGITAGADGQRLLLTNVGANNIVLVHDATSTAANRFYCPGSANLTLNANDSAFVEYDGTSSRWRVIGV